MSLEEEACFMNLSMAANAQMIAAYRTKPRIMLPSPSFHCEIIPILLQFQTIIKDVVQACL